MNTPLAERLVSGSPQDEGKDSTRPAGVRYQKTEHEHVNDHVFRQRPVVVNVPRRPWRARARGRFL